MFHSSLIATSPSNLLGNALGNVVASDIVQAYLLSVVLISKLYKNTP